LGNQHYEEPGVLYFSPNIIRLVNSRKKIWAENEPRRGRGEVNLDFCWGNLRERDHLEEPDTDGKIILEWILDRWVGAEAWTGLLWLRVGKVEGTCKRGNKISGSIKRGKFLD
jgi:hypothetical protein